MAGKNKAALPTKGLLLAMRDAANKIGGMPLSGALQANPHHIRAGSNRSSDYDGPFAVVAETGASVTIYGANAQAGRPAPATVTLGTTVSTFADKTLSVSATGYVYLEITYSSSYTITAKSGATMTQDDTHYCVPLAYVVLNDGKISSIQQLQFGQVEGAGRIF